MDLRLPADWQELPTDDESMAGVIGRFARGQQRDGPELTVIYRPSRAFLSLEAANTLFKDLGRRLGGSILLAGSYEADRPIGPLMGAEVAGRLVWEEEQWAVRVRAVQLPNDYVLGLVLRAPHDERGQGRYLQRIAETVTPPDLPLQAGPRELTVGTLRFSLPADLQAYLPDGTKGNKALVIRQGLGSEVHITLFATFLGPERQPDVLLADLYRDAFGEVDLPGRVEAARFGKREGFTLSTQRGIRTVDIAGVSEGSEMAVVMAFAMHDQPSALQEAVAAVLSTVQLQPPDFDRTAAVETGRRIMEQLADSDPFESWARPGQLNLRIEFLAGGEGVQSQSVARAADNGRQIVAGEDRYRVRLPDTLWSGRTQWVVDLDAGGFTQQMESMVEFTEPETVRIRSQATDRQDGRGQTVHTERIRERSRERPNALTADWTPDPALLPDPMEIAAHYLIASGQVAGPALFQRTQYRSPYPAWQLVRALPTAQVVTDLPDSPHHAAGVDILDDFDHNRLRIYFDQDGQLLRVEVGRHFVMVRTTEEKFEAAERRLRAPGRQRRFEGR